MKKVIDFINKKYDTNFFKNSYVKNKNTLMEPVFKENRISIKDNDELQFFRNEIIYLGLKHKREIENAYFEGKTMMQDYYDTLDYEEKVRLINYETNSVITKMPFEIYNDKKIYIPFLDEKMNHVYREEMALFDLKLYHRYQFDCNEIFKNDLYGWFFYDGIYTNANVIYQENEHVALYSNAVMRLYFFENDKLVDHLSLIDSKSLDVLKKICDLYFQKDLISLISYLKDSGLIKEKDIKKTEKILSKELK